MIHRIIRILLLSFFVVCSMFSFAQDDLEALLDEETDKIVLEEKAAFKTSRIITAHSTEQMPKYGLDFRISHRFGSVKGGAYELFGIDQSSSFFSLEYGLNKRINIGLGRASYQKIYYSFAKFRIFSQTKGTGSVPLTVSYLTSCSLNSLKYSNPDISNYFASRLTYVHQLLVSRKFNNELSLQLSPTIVHRNLVDTKQEKNDLLSVGIGGRYKITNRTSVNFEYFYVPGLQHELQEYKMPLSIGVDIQAGSHVFQVHITNSRGMTEDVYLSQTQGDWTKGEVFIGFNISQVFTLRD